jgi:hypothetical protein
MVDGSQFRSGAFGTRRQQPERDSEGPRGRRRRVHERRAAGGEAQEPEWQQGPKRRSLTQVDEFVVQNSEQKALTSRARVGLTARVDLIHLGRRNGSR